LTEEMRQGRGDDDYSSLFRQYLPSGGPLEIGVAAKDDQPRLAGIDEEKRSEPGTVIESAAVEAAASSKNAEEKMEPSSDVKADPAASPSSKVEVSARSKAEDKDEKSGAPALSGVAAANDSAFSFRSTPEPAAKSADVSAVASPSPENEERSEAPRGMWGGFWKRRTEN
jgi:hypothetical protein